MRPSTILLRFIHVYFFFNSIISGGDPSSTARLPEEFRNDYAAAAELQPDEFGSSTPTFKKLKSYKTQDIILILRTTRIIDDERTSNTAQKYSYDRTNEILIGTCRETDVE